MARGRRRCANCGQFDSGRFCSRCSADLTLQSTDGWAASFVNVTGIGALRDSVLTYLKILRSPTAVTLALTDDPTFQSHLSFLSSALGLYLLIVLSTGFSLRTHDAIAQTVTSVAMFGGMWLVAIVSFRIFRWQTADRSREQTTYLKLICLVYGFATICGGVWQGIQELAFPVIGFAGFLLTTLLIILYIIRVQARFWQTRKRTALLLWCLSSLPGAAFAIILMAGSARIFGIDNEQGLRALASPLDPPTVTLTDAMLAEIAEEQNQKQKLPRRIDAETELTKMSSASGTLISNYRLVRFSAAEVNSTALVSTVRPQAVLHACATRARSEVLERGVAMGFAYFDKNGQPIVNFVVTKGDCPSP